MNPSISSFFPFLLVASKSTTTTTSSSMFLLLFLLMMLDPPDLILPRIRLDVLTKSDLPEKDSKCTASTTSSVQRKILLKSPRSSPFRFILAKAIYRVLRYRQAKSRYRFRVFVIVFHLDFWHFSNPNKGPFDMLRHY